MTSLKQAKLGVALMTGASTGIGDATLPGAAAAAGSALAARGAGSPEGSNRGRTTSAKLNQAPVEPLLGVLR